MQKRFPYRKTGFETKAHEWNSIELFYSNLGWEQAKYLGELVRHIKISGLDKRLFAFTTLDKLVVSIYNPIDKFTEALHIRYDPRNKKWEFEYYAKPFQEPEFCRSYDAEKGIEKFDNFIQMIKW